MSQALKRGDHRANVAQWKDVVIKYQEPSLMSALWQLSNTFLPFLFIWYLMYRTLGISWWLTLSLAVINAGFTMRLFIIFHDCGHGSFFNSKVANDILGFCTGVLMFTSYHHWRWEHSVHHATTGHLDKRGTGDVWTLTVQEYLESSRWKRFSYRITRNPFILFVIAPLVLFLILERIPSKKAPKKERNMLYLTNLAIAFMVACGIWIFGLKAYLLIQLTTMTLVGSAGVWMFYVQHQFEDTYWERGSDWDYTTAALKGSSYYKLPKVLQWISGNIGFHHIHHLNSRIPNYNLEKCHKSHPLFQQVKAITLFSSFKSFTYRLWDEQQKKLVGYRHLRELRKQQAK